MMDEFGIAALDELGGHIIETSRARHGWRRSRKLPRGTWKATMRIDGYDAPIDLDAAVDDRAPTHRGRLRRHLGLVELRHQLPDCYTEAYTAFG